MSAVQEYCSVWEATLETGITRTFPYALSTPPVSHQARLDALSHHPRATVASFPEFCERLISNQRRRAQEEYHR